MGKAQRAHQSPAAESDDGRAALCPSYRPMAPKSASLALFLALAILTWLPVAGWATTTVYQYAGSIPSPGTESLLSGISEEIAGKVFYTLKAGGDRHVFSKLAVVIAVPLSDLKRETEFGRLIAEYLLTDLADRGLQVKELRLGKDILIVPLTGEFIMSRNIGELAEQNPELDYVVVSTFSNTRKNLILQGRAVNLKTNLVEVSWRYSLPLTKELLALFHEAEQPFTIPIKGMQP